MKRASVALAGNTKTRILVIEGKGVVLVKLGGHHSEETLAKMSAANIGKHHSPETCAKISAAKMGHAPSAPKHHTAETKAKISAACKGHGKGIAKPAEQRTKMSAAGTGTLNSGWRGGRAVVRKRCHAKRRDLGFNPLNSPFVDCEGHHINETDVIYIPRVIHRGISHNIWTGRNMIAINALAGLFLMEDWA